MQKLIKVELRKDGRINAIYDDNSVQVAVLMPIGLQGTRPTSIVLDELKNKQIPICNELKAYLK